MEISRLQTRIAGLESESSSKASRVTQLEEELGSMLTELENSEVKQVELEAQLEVLQNAVDKQWEVRVMGCLVATLDSCQLVHHFLILVPITSSGHLTKPRCP